MEYCLDSGITVKAPDLIDREALLGRIYGPERPEICDGAEEADWILQCLREAPAIEPEAATIEVDMAGTVIHIQRVDAPAATQEA